MIDPIANGAWCVPPLAKKTDVREDILSRDVFDMYPLHRLNE
jgi:hypothetical protein